MSLNHLLGARTPLTDVKVHNLDVTETLTAGAITIGGFTPNSAVITDGSGILTTGLVSLLTQTTDTLSISRGGTNSTTALLNGLLMQSLGGKIVESSIMPSQVAVLPIDLVTQTTGVLSIVKGGTNSNTPLTNGFLMQSLGGKIVETSITPASIASLPITLTTQTAGLLSIVQGGTNSSSALNNNRTMFSSGGAIVEGSALLNGQFFVGNTGGAPTPATITVSSNLSIINGAGAISLDTIQAIQTTSSPTFNALTLNGILTLNSLTASLPLKLNASKQIISQLISLTGDVSGTLPIGSGGTASTTALTNGKIMISSGGAIVEGTSNTNPVFTSVFTSTVPAVVQETYDLVPNYIIKSGGVGVNAPSTTYTGATYLINKPMVFTKINFSIAAGTTPGNMDFAIYQRSGGGSANTANPASLIGSVRFVGATGGNQATITGSGILSPGVVYILYARNSGNQTLRIYANMNALLLNGADLASGYAPYSFTTGITSSASPASTFDPTVQTATNADVALICRLLA